MGSGHRRVRGLTIGHIPTPQLCTMVSPLLPIYPTLFARYLVRNAAAQQLEREREADAKADALQTRGDRGDRLMHLARGHLEGVALEHSHDYGKFVVVCIPGIEIHERFKFQNEKRP